MTEPNRTQTITTKARTPFGSMYVHVEFDECGRVVGGAISDPQKEPDAQIARMILALSDALNEALKVEKT